jgi:hypothetical protein
LVFAETQSPNKKPKELEISEAIHEHKKGKKSTVSNFANAQ